MKLSLQEQETIDAYNQNASAFSKSRNKVGAWLEEKQKLKTLLKQGKILDIGCGSGRDAKELINLGFEYIGIDYSEKLLEESRKNNPGVLFLKQSVYELDFPKNSFDSFWACAILLHMPKDKINNALKSIHGVMKTGAIGCITLKKGEGEKFVDDDHSGIQYKRFFSFYQQDEFINILNRNNFDVLESYEKDRSNKKWLVFFVSVK